MKQLNNRQYITRLSFYWLIGLLISCSQFAYAEVSANNLSTATFIGSLDVNASEKLSPQTFTLAAIQHAMLIAMILMVSIYSLTIWVHNNFRHRAMWLTFTCFSSAIFFLTCGDLLEKIIAPQSTWFYDVKLKAHFITLTWMAYSLFRFYDARLSHYLSAMKISLITGSTHLTLFLFLILPSSTINSTIFIFSILWGALAASSLWILFKATYDKVPYSRLMLLAASPLILSIPLDFHSHSQSHEMPIYSLYAVIFFVFIETLVIGRKLGVAFHLIEHLSNNMKEEVELQTSILNDKNKKLEYTQKALKNANESLRKLSITDGLTQVYNRMYFERELHKEWRRCARQNAPVSILMIDADHFKKINDSAGHLAGDRALQAIAEQLKQRIKRAGDLVARYGGEEFVVMMPETDQRKALAVAESLRSSIEKMGFKHHDVNHKITVSIGVSTTTPSMNISPDNLLEAADAALYDVKNSGRNQIAHMPLITSKSSSNRFKQSN